MPTDRIYENYDKEPTFATSVNWGRGTFVSVGVLRVPEGDDGFGPETEGFHITLDRGQINTYIRSLRRARDQAYGADE